MRIGGGKSGVAPDLAALLFAPWSETPAPFVDRPDCRPHHPFSSMHRAARLQWLPEGVFWQRGDRHPRLPNVRCLCAQLFRGSVLLHSLADDPHQWASPLYPHHHTPSHRTNNSTAEAARKHPMADVFINYASFRRW